MYLSVRGRFIVVDAEALNALSRLSPQPVVLREPPVYYLDKIVVAKPWRASPTGFENVEGVGEVERPFWFADAPDLKELVLEEPLVFKRVEKLVAEGDLKVVRYSIVARCGGKAIYGSCVTGYLPFTPAGYVGEGEAEGISVLEISPRGEE